MDAITSLLYEVGKIKDFYRQTDRANGNDYNVYEILNIGAKEVIHTYFIADLLNPRGLHGLGDVPLKLFLEIIEKSKWFQEDFKAFAEKPYGTIDWKKVTGGNIDISLESQIKSIVIENKLDAEDQNKQLERYYNTFNQNCNLVYLSKDGKVPSDKSRGNLSLDKITLVSYQQDITEWIELCIEKAVNRPRLRETLNQYLTQVKELTGQSTNSKMSTEIVSLLNSSTENLENAFTIAENIDNLKKDIMRNVPTRFKELWTEYEGWRFSENSCSKPDETYWDVRLTLDINHYELIACLEEDKYSVGILNQHQSKELSDSQIRIYDKMNQFMKCDFSKNGVWPSWVWCSSDLREFNFNSKQSKTWIDMYENLPKYLVSKLRDMIDHLNQEKIDLVHMLP